jgi:hypothetical protein
MTDLLLQAARFSALMVWVGAFLAVSMAAAVVLERIVFALGMWRRRRIERRYEPIVERAVKGDDAARDELVASPWHYRIVLAWLLITPLITDRDPQRIARTRAIARAMSLVPVADRLLRSRLWWRRALALRALGLLQETTHTGAIVAALDDPNVEVRAAALDAIADLRDMASLQAVVVRFHDESLHRGRRLAAIAAFGRECEPFLLELADVDMGKRLDYARALAICGTERSRPTLCRWTQDRRADVRAATFEALGRIGLDESAAALAVAALESSDVKVRATAAYALQGWAGPGDVASRLALHLDDAWPVAVQAAQSLQTMRDAGIIALRASVSRPGLAGVLARQTLWEIGAPC